MVNLTNSIGYSPDRAIQEDGLPFQGLSSVFDDVAVDLVDTLYLLLEQHHREHDLIVLNKVLEVLRFTCQSDSTTF